MENRRCPRGYSMSTQGVCTQSLGGNSPLEYWAHDCHSCMSSCLGALNNCGGYHLSPPAHNGCCCTRYDIMGGPPGYTHYYQCWPCGNCSDMCDALCFGGGYAGPENQQGEHGGGRNWSDINLKENIELIGKSKSGINIYEFDYKNKKYGEGRYRGVMAQEVPEASFDNGGYLMVDYNKIDVEFRRK